MKKLLYSISVALFAVLGLASCSSEDYGLGAGRVIGDALSWNVVEDGNTFTFTNTSQAVDGVTYYITTDGRSSKEFPIGATEELKVKKNGFYVVSLYAVSRGDQKSLSWTKNVDWFEENVADPQWLGFTDGNLLAGASAEIGTWWADGSWNGDAVTDPAVEGSLADGYSFVTVENGGSQWQAQVHINNTGVAVSSGKTYDFSIAIISTADSEGDGVTVKPQMDGDDGVFFSEARHPIHKGVNVITLTDLAGFDGNFKIAFDFAGVPAGTEITIKNIFLGEHDASRGASADTWAFDFTSESNLLKEAASTNKFWIADDNWGELFGDSFTGFEGNAGEFVFTAPEGMGHSQWQGQAHVNFGVALSAGKSYDFSLVLLSDADAEGVTVKPHPDGDDGTFFSEARHALKAGVPTAVTLPACAGFDGTFVLTLDFAGTPANAQVRVLGVYLGESK